MVSVFERDKEDSVGGWNKIESKITLRFHPNLT